MSKGKRRAGREGKHHAGMWRSACWAATARLRRRESPRAGRSELHGKGKQAADGGKTCAGADSFAWELDSFRAGTIAVGLQARAGGWFSDHEASTAAALATPGRLSGQGG
ncbi:unnamed protein product [Urochloa humidicola]